MKETDASCSNLIDGKAIAEAVNRETASEVANIAKQYGAVPGLAVVLVGDNPASQVYVNTKVKKCAELGIYSEKIVLPKETTQAELLEVIGSSYNTPPFLAPFLNAKKALVIGPSKPTIQRP